MMMTRIAVRGSGETAPESFCGLSCADAIVTLSVSAAAAIEPRIVFFILYLPLCCRRARSHRHDLRRDDCLAVRGGDLRHIRKALVDDGATCVSVQRRCVLWW